MALYRGRGIGQRLLHRSLSAAAKEPNVEDVYLHVRHTAPLHLSVAFRCSYGVSACVVSLVPGRKEGRGGEDLNEHWFALGARIEPLLTFRGVNAFVTTVVRTLC